MDVSASTPLLVLPTAIKDARMPHLLVFYSSETRNENTAIPTRACSYYCNALMMSAKTMHPRKSTSSFSKRVKMRRHPCNRRNTRAISLRRLYISRSYAQGSTRLRRGGTTGAYPSATAKCRVWAPSYARSISNAGCAGGGPRRVSHGRPAGAAGACPGESEQTRAVRSRGNPMHRGGPPASGAAEGLRAGCVRAPGPAGGTLTRGRASDRASRLRRTIGARCRRSQTRSRTPGCDPRGSRRERGGARGPSGAATRALSPCAATDQRAGRTGRGERRTGPRGPGRGGALRAYGAYVRSIHPGDHNHAHEWEQALGQSHSRSCSTPAAWR